jgi:beta-lactamase superfamily II metal-dependent hydrolase
MLFTLEALDATFGDALLLHYGTKSAPKLIVIDGGPSKVYQNTLRKRLMEIRNARTPEDTLKLRTIMISHIDNDHIVGILDLMREIEAAEQAGQDPPFDAPSLWFNSFDDLVKPVGVSSLSPAAAGVAAVDMNVLVASPSSFKDEDTRVIAAAVPEGRRLRQIALGLDWNLNPDFEDLGGLVVAPANGKLTRSMGSGLSFTVAGPMRAEFDALRNRWADTVQKLKKKGKISAADITAEAVAFLDESVANLSSIAVLAESGGKTMLLTGDARGDKVEDGLEASGLLKKEKTLHVDLLKVPHHGSDRNVAKSFFERITAAHYVISADGTNGNPDGPTLKWLVEARGQDRYTIHLTNKVPAAAKYLDGAQKNHKFKVDYRKASAKGVTIDLGEPLED